MKRILLLQTGGTIAMEIRNETDEEVSGPVGKDKLLKIAPSLTELAHVEIRDLFFKDSSNQTALTCNRPIGYASRMKSKENTTILMAL